MTAAITVQALCVSYGGRKVIVNFSMELAQGEAVLVKGPSGCGKSTLLNAICGLIPGSIEAEISGGIFLSGRNVDKLSRLERASEIGVVFQNPNTQLFCDTVEDEIAFGIENLCLPKEELIRRVEAMLTLTGLTGYRFRSPSKLSGGQQQLVVLASVLAMNPKTLLLDEALSQLDAGGKELFVSYITGLKHDGHTLLMVDHDETLMPVADRVINMVSYEQIEN